MKPILLPIFLLLLFSCQQHSEEAIQATKEVHLLDDIPAFTQDSLVQVVIEIPTGTHEKWEVNKNTGQLEWQKINADSSRVIDYLAYPANYGFVPQTLVAEETGGDGDPVDIFVLGPAVPRGSILEVRIIGMVRMLDSGEEDSKLIGIDTKSNILNVKSIEGLSTGYPGVLEILRLWLENYKGRGKVELGALLEMEYAVEYLKMAAENYQKELAEKT